MQSSGLKLNLNKKEGESRQIIIFYNLRPDYFFFKWEGKAGGGDDPGQLKKFGQGGHMGVLTNIYFKALFFF